MPAGPGRETNLKKEVPTITAVPKKTNWIWVAGNTNHHVEWQLSGTKNSKKMIVALDFEASEKEKNMEQVQRIEQNKEHYEKVIGEPLKFSYNRGKWTRVYVEKEVRLLENMIQKEELKRWAVEKMATFCKAFKELI